MSGTGGVGERSPPRTRAALWLVAGVVLGAPACNATTVESRRVLVVGNSILDQASDEVLARLDREGWDTEVAADSGSSIQRWPGRLRDLVAAHDPSVVVVELGTNNCASGSCPMLEARLDEALHALADVEHVLWLDVQTDPGYPQGAERVNHALESAAAVRPNLEILGFSDEFSGHPEWHTAGGVHLSEEGEDAFADFVAEALSRYTVEPDN